MISVLFGLLGFSIVVFVHELGHLLAAKAVGVEVLAFSVGLGRPILRRTWRGTEYRLSILPLGGYCKMKGEQALIRAWAEKRNQVDVEPGDFLAARPLARILVLAAGPGVNYLFAVLVFAVVAIVGFRVSTYPSRIVVADPSDSQSPAVAAGIETGDRITAINGTPIETFWDLQEAVRDAEAGAIDVAIERGGERFTASVTPRQDPASGRRLIEVVAWIEPLVAEIAAGSPAERAGLAVGDRIVAIDGTMVQHAIEFERELESGGGRPVTLLVQTDGGEREVRLVPGTGETGNPVTGIAYEQWETRTETRGPILGIVEGVRQANAAIVGTVQGLAQLVSGRLDPREAVMGPPRIFYLVGRVTIESAAEGIGRALLNLFNILSIISLSLAIFNLIPIPVLDGGQIVLTLWELITRHRPSPRLTYHYQMVGVVLILGLLIFVVVNDVLFLSQG